MDKNISGPDIDEQLYSPPLTEDQKLLRDAFVAEYMKDFDSYRAVLRLGFYPTLAIQWAKQLYADGYVQQQLAILTRAPPKDPEAQDVADRALIENTYRDAMQNAPYATRVAAGKAMSELKGWNKPDVSEDAGGMLSDLLREFAQKVPV